MGFWKPEFTLCSWLLVVHPMHSIGPECMPVQLAGPLWGTCTLTDYGGMEETSNTGNCMIVVWAKLLIDMSGLRGLPRGTQVFPILGLPCCPTDLPRSPQIWLPLKSEVSATASLARFHCSLSLPFTQHITAHLLSAPPSGSTLTPPTHPKSQGVPCGLQLYPVCPHGKLHIPPTGTKHSRNLSGFSS